MKAPQAYRRLVGSAFLLGALSSSVMARQPARERIAVGGDSGGGRLQTVLVGFPPSAPGIYSEDVALLPHTLRAPSAMRPLLDRMWHASPTFRRQCARLTQASTLVSIHLGLPGNLAGTRALTKIRMRHGSITEASVHLGTVTPELVAHEIEHVLEQIDGVDLRTLIEGGVRGAYKETGRIETARATFIGRLVATDLSRAPLPRRHAVGAAGTTSLSKR